MTRMDPRMAQRRRTVQETHARKSLRRLVRVLGVLAFAAAIVWAFRSPLLAVQHIDVAGASQVDVTAVLRAQGIDEGVAMMDVDVDSAVSRLLDDPWVKTAEAWRDWPQTVTIEIQERIPVAWVSTGGVWHHVAVDGVALFQADQPAAGEPAIIYSVGGSAVTAGDRDLVGLLEFVTNLPIEYRAGTAVAPGESGFVARVAGYQVRLGTGERGREKAMALTAILETSPQEGSIITVIAPGEPAVLAPGAGGGSDSTPSTDQNPEDG